MNENKIAHENGNYWVADMRTHYSVMVCGPVNSVSESAYAHNPDGLSIAIARANYLARERPEGKYPRQAL